MASRQFHSVCRHARFRTHMAVRANLTGALELGLCSWQGVRSSGPRDPWSRAGHARRRLPPRPLHGCRPASDRLAADLALSDRRLGSWRSQAARPAAPDVLQDVRCAPTSPNPDLIGRSLRPGDLDDASRERLRIVLPAFVGATGRMRWIAPDREVLDARLGPRPCGRGSRSTSRAAGRAPASAQRLLDPVLARPGPSWPVLARGAQPGELLQLACESSGRRHMLSATWRPREPCPRSHPPAPSLTHAHAPALDHPHRCCADGRRGGRL
jgi:hypothetical protein